FMTCNQVTIIDSDELVDLTSDDVFIFLRIGDHIFPECPTFSESFNLDQHIIFTRNVGFRQYGYFTIK
ncbi:MAG: hypothetical protein ACRCVU_18510, partial [Flavobacterium sp.]